MTCSRASSFVLFTTVLDTTLVMALIADWTEEEMAANFWKKGGGAGEGLGVGEVARRAPVVAPAPVWVRDGSELYLPL